MVTETVTFNEKRKGLSEKESYLLSCLAENRKNVFELKDVMDVLNCSYEHAKVIVYRLIKKRWVERIIKGKYMIIPLSAGIKAMYAEHEFIIASLFKPSYIAYWSALNYYGFTEQIPNKVFVATTKRIGSRKIFGMEFKFIYLSKRKFFGFTEIAISNFKVRISDKEKTIIDCLDKPRYCGGICEIAKAIFLAKDEIDFKKLTGYALKMGNNAIIKRLGFILDFLGLDSKDLEKYVKKSHSVLDPTRRREGEYNPKWKLLVNVSKEELMW